MPHIPVAVIVSATSEWRIVVEHFPDSNVSSSPLGDWFVVPLTAHGGSTSTSPASVDATRSYAAPVVFFHGGWGKIAAAASAQYVIDHWKPEVIINLGTCGGFAGRIERGTVVLAERTLVYDILEQMGDPDDAIAHFTTDLDLGWLGATTPYPVLRTVLVSADRDLVVDELPGLVRRYGAVAGDWESGAIAYIAARNQIRCLILRGVSDLVGPDGGEAYDGTMATFVTQAGVVMGGLLQQLPAWIVLALADTRTDASTER